MAAIMSEEEESSQEEGGDKEHEAAIDGWCGLLESSTSASRSFAINILLPHSLDISLLLQLSDMDLTASGSAMAVGASEADDAVTFRRLTLLPLGGMLGKS